MWHFTQDSSAFTITHLSGFSSWLVSLQFCSLGSILFEGSAIHRQVWVFFFLFVVIIVLEIYSTHRYSIAKKLLRPSWPPQGWKGKFIGILRMTAVITTLLQAKAVWERARHLQTLPLSLSPLSRIPKSILPGPRRGSRRCSEKDLTLTIFSFPLWIMVPLLLVIKDIDVATLPLLSTEGPSAPATTVSRGPGY